MLNKYRTKYVWCLHCEKAFKTENIRKYYEDGLEMAECPYCEASELDIHEWRKNDFPREANPQYPEVPEEGKVYPLYGKE